jgi:hypothetical protein
MMGLCCTLISSSFAAEREALNPLHVHEANSLEVFNAYRQLGFVVCRILNSGHETERVVPQKVVPALMETLRDIYAQDSISYGIVALATFLRNRASSIDEEEEARQLVESVYVAASSDSSGSGSEPSDGFE